MPIILARYIYLLGQFHFAIMSKYVTIIFQLCTICTIYMKELVDNYTKYCLHNSVGYLHLKVAPKNMCQDESFLTVSDSRYGIHRCLNTILMKLKFKYTVISDDTQVNLVRMMDIALSHPYISWLRYRLPDLWRSGMVVWHQTYSYLGNTMFISHLCHIPSRWRHNGRDGVSNHHPHDCLLKRLFRRRSKETLKLPVTWLCVGNSLVTGEVPTQMASSAENFSIWWRHHAQPWICWMIAGRKYVLIFKSRKDCETKQTTCRK